MRRLARDIAALESQALSGEVTDLRNAEAADRVSQHIARLLATRSRQRLRQSAHATG